MGCRNKNMSYNETLSYRECCKGSKSSKGNIVSETTTTTTAASKKAASTVADNIPVIVETAELAVEVPAKVVLNNKLVVAVSLVAGAAVGAGVLWGVNKWRARKAEETLEVPNDLSELDEESHKN